MLVSQAPHPPGICSIHHKLDLDEAMTQ